MKTEIEITKDNFIQQLKVKKSKKFFTDGQIYKLNHTVIKNYNRGKWEDPFDYTKRETAYNILKKLEGSIIKNVKTGIRYYVLNIDDENTRVIELNTAPIVFYIEQMMFYTFKYPNPNDSHLYMEKKLILRVTDNNETQCIQTNLNTFEILGKANIGIKDITPDFIKSIYTDDCVKNWVKKIEELEYKNGGSNYYRKLDAHNDKMAKLRVAEKEYYAEQNRVLTPQQEYAKSQMSGKGIHIDIWRCPISSKKSVENVGMQNGDMALKYYSRNEVQFAHSYLYPQTMYEPNDMTVGEVLQYQSEKRHEMDMMYHNDPDLLYKQLCGGFGLKM